MALRTIDIGDDPPLVTADNRTGPPDRRKVSLRWLTGTILAASVSTFLMGGALYVAFEGRQSVAMPANEVALSPPSAAETDSELLRKADMLSPASPEAQTRQIMHLSTISTDRDKQVIKLKPFARIATPLLASADEIVDPVPPFNPLRIFADANPEQGDADVLYGAKVDGQMTIKVSDFPMDDPSLAPVAPLNLVATEVLVRDNARFLDGASVQIAALPYLDSTRLDAGFAGIAAFDQPGVRIIPENVSFIATTSEAETVASAFYSEVKHITVAEEDDFTDLLTAHEATDEEAAEIILQMKKSFALDALEEGDRLSIELAAAGEESGRYRPVRVSLYRNGEHIGTVALSDRQGYVAAAEPRREGDELFAAAAEAEEEKEAKRPRLYESLYQTALANGMSPGLIDEMIRVFSFDIDFNTRVAPGDALEVVYSLKDDETESSDHSEILYTALTIGGVPKRFYRYKTPDDGLVDYYDQDGKSAKKSLLRKPMSGGTFRSGFGARRHPLLGYVRAHTGVDWSAPRGTPIMAAGDGLVTYADWKSGYGNYIVVRHSNGYESAYAHQTGFAKGIKKGVKVRQGQIIGYVGSTGLSTGPHLHYEVHVNGTPVDPLRIKLPRGRSLSGEVLALFNEERARIDTLLGGGAGQKLAMAAPPEP